MAKSNRLNTQGTPIASADELVKADKVGEIELTEDDLKRVAGGAIQLQKLQNKESRDDSMQSR